MTHLLSTSVSLHGFYRPLPSKAWRRYDSPEYFPNPVQRRVHPTQVHIQITISQYSYVDDSNVSLGSALVRFERSTLPNHEGTRTVVLRFLRIITPVKCVKPLYDGHIVQPKEGELHRRFPTNVQVTDEVDPNSLVWSINIDKRKGPAIKQGLRLLWDA